jgi:hypothetical protein
MSRSTSSTLRALSLVVCVILSTVMAHAQYRASIQGVVTDPQGAVVSGATITLSNNETNHAQITTSNDAGVYNFGGLPPSKYTITAEKTGFKKQILDDVNVLAEQANSVNVRLELGEASETVTVTDATPAIDTESGTISGTITSKEVENLPSIGRDPFQLLRLTPGVFGDGANGAGGGGAGLPSQNQVGSSPTASIFMIENQPGIVANGTRNNSNSYQIDGVQVNSLTWGGSAIITPNEESVKEVQIQSNSYSAENGRGAGAQVLVVSQNGTNEVHGSLFLKIHRPGLDAFQRWNGPNKVQRDASRFNQFGGSLGGPVIKNRFFLFFSYETLRNDTVNTGSGWYVTPQFNTAAAAAHSGSIASQWASRPGVNAAAQSINDSSLGSLNDCAHQGFIEFNPVTKVGNCQSLAGGLDIGSPLTSTLGTKDPSYGTAASPFGIGNGLDGIPDIFNVNTVNPTKQTSTQYNGRADFQATSKDLVAFSVYWVPSDNTSYNGPARPINLYHSQPLNYSGALLWTRTFSPTVLNEARFNVSRWYYNDTKTNPQLAFGYPDGNVTNLGNVNMGGQGQLFGPPGPGIFYQTGYNFRDTLSKVHGSHALKFGTDDYKDQVQEVVTWAGLPPAYQFNNLWDWTNDAPLYEQGNFDPRTGKPTGTKKNTRDNIDAFFVQDNYRVRSNLTVNLGLRWEYFGPLHEKDGNLGVVDLGAGSATLTALSVKDNRNAFNTSHNNWGPQLGFAWSPNSLRGHSFSNKLVLRGGFGVGYTRPQPAITLSGRFNVPITTYFGNLRGSQLLYAPSSNPNNVYGFPANPAAVETFDATSGLPTCAPLTCGAVSLTAFDHNLKTPRAEHYSIEGQYDLGSHWVATLGYQGSRSHNGFSQVGNLNWLYPNNLNPAVSGVDFYTNNVDAHYNALLAEVQHQFARTFSIDSQYTYSHCKDHGSQDYYEDPYPFNINAAYGNCDFDATHSFKAYGLWSPRIFRGAHDWREKVLGGWQLSGIYAFHTGFPFGGYLNGVQLNGGCNLIYNASNFCQAPLAGYKGGAGSSASNSTFEKAFGNFPQLAGADLVTGANSYFTMPTFSATGVPSGPGIERNPFRGPRYHDFDFTLGKDFGLPANKILGENAMLALRANFYNLFNTLNLSPISGYQNIASSVQLDPTTHQINGFSSNSQFGQAQSALGARVVEIQARFSF